MATSNNIKVSNQTSSFINALHIHGAKFYSEASNAIACMYSEDSPIFKEFSDKYMEMQAIMEKCIICSIEEQVNNSEFNSI